MQIIIQQALATFSSPPEPGQLATYIKTHSFFNRDFNIAQISQKIVQKLKQNIQKSHEVQQKIGQLALYLNVETNPLMFQIYRIVLMNPQGITYRDIAVKTKLEIVNISHYCCRLKRMNFVELKHVVCEKKVYPKDSPHVDSNSNSNVNSNFNAQSNVNGKEMRDGVNKTNEKFERSQLNKGDDDEEPVSNCQEKKTFFFHELSIVDNIWVNVSSYDSYVKNGVTNQDIKTRVNKNSQIKLIMKLVEQVRDIYKFQRQMVSEGKVFQNRYKNVTKQICNFGMEPVSQPQILEKLHPNIEKWLKEKYPNLAHLPQQKFLLDFINNQLKDYLTASGVKSAKRTCTPIKLIRYIKILNSLNVRWPQTHNELKKFLIDEQKSLPNGTMHKRSIMGILQGLVSKQILRKQSIKSSSPPQREYSQRESKQNKQKYYLEEEKQFLQKDFQQKDVLQKEQQFYYPMWQPLNQGIDVGQQYRRLAKTKKKVHLSGLQDHDKNNKQFANKISLKQYKEQLVITLLSTTLYELYISTLRKSFRRIQLSKRSKVQIRNYEPELNILHLLDNNCIENVGKELQVTRSQNYNDFVESVDDFVEKIGRKEKKIVVGYQSVKLFRKYPSISENQLKQKLGNGWMDKIKTLIEQGWIRKGGRGWEGVPGKLFL